MEENRNKILNKIESWADRLPYVSCKIEIQMRDETYVLEKNKSRPIGFVCTENEGGK